MLRIVDAAGRAYNRPGFDVSTAVAYVGTPGDTFKVRALDLGNGHVEASAVRNTVWTECDWSLDYLKDVLAAIERARMERDQAEVLAEHRKRAARRAKTRVRRLCKVMGADTLITLTYRGWQPDLDLCKRHLKEFNRRMLRVLPTFCLVACFEQQKPNLQIGRPEGSWHVHMATRGIPAALPGLRGEWRSFNVIRAIWRSVTGELAGNVDVSRRKRNSDKSAAQVAAYISKYIGKGFEDEGAAGRNRYAVYGEVEVPEPVELQTAATLHEAIEATYGVLLDGQSICTARLDNWQDWFFVSGEIRRR